MQIRSSFNRNGFTQPKAAAALFIAVFIICCAAGAEEPEAKAPATTVKAGDHLILNNQSYFRIYNEFGPMRLNSDALRKEGQALFGKRAFSGLEKNAKRLLKHCQYDWSKTDWREVACYHMFTGQAGSDHDAIAMLRPEKPDKGWADIGFDDSGFDCQRLGYLTRTLGGQSFREAQSLLRRGHYLRTYFEIPELSAAGDLTVRISYRGGARILINGTEIARKHLPEGDITSKTFGTDYPKEAYLALADELPPRPAHADYIGDIRSSFDEASRDRRNKNDPKYRVTYGNTSINRKGWERISKLRDRVIGPIPIPRSLLKKGYNVLAIEIRSARYHPIIVSSARAVGKESRNDKFRRAWGGSMGRNLRWDHARLLDVSLTSTSESIPSCLARPKGFQVWAADMNRWLVNKDYNPKGFPAGTLRFVSGQNGTASVQMGTGTDKALSDFKAEVTALEGPGGTIPAEAITVLYGVGHHLYELGQLGNNRCFRKDWGEVGPTLLWRYSDGKHLYGKLPKDRRQAKDAKKKYIERFNFFDHLSAKTPATISANSCQSVWLRLKVPEGTTAGIYKGSVSVSASGVEPVTLPVEAEVIGWRVPSPREFQTIVQSEQSPFGILKHYKVKPWSDEHWRLIGSSFKELARLGNDWLFIPVLMNSELGNKEHVMVTGIRKEDGSYGFDFSLADKYLALARRVQGEPRMVCFLVMQAARTKSNAVRILDEATGKIEAMEVGPAQAATRTPFWHAFGAAVYAHMKKLGLEDSLYFGQPFDDVPDKPLIGILSQVVPNAAWSCGTHMRAPDETFRCSGRMYGVDVTDKSKLSWKNPYIHLLITRTGGSVLCVEGITPPFAWRVWPDRALYAGFNGIGRAGADYFAGAWFDGVKERHYCMAGRASVMTLWPGSDIVESSARHEALLEGIQESDARIYMEQAIDRCVLPKALAEEAQAVLDDHFRATLHLPVGIVDAQTMDIAQSTQKRTQRLFKTAARVAAASGVDVDKTEFGGGKLSFTRGGRKSGAIIGSKVEVPFLGQTRLELKLRNWGSLPRDWKASADKPWIIPEKTSGKLVGHQVLGITLDGSTLKVGEEVSGTLTVTDTALGTTYPVTIAAVVTKALEYQTRQDVKFISGGGAGARSPHTVHIIKEPVFNVTIGSQESQTYYLRNHAKDALDWKIDTNKNWIKTVPSSGKIPVGASIPVSIEAAPTDKQAAAHEVTLTLTAADGKIEETYPIKVNVIQPYQKPQLPEGESVFLNEVDIKRCDKLIWAGYYKGRKGKRPYRYKYKDPTPDFNTPTRDHKVNRSEHYKYPYKMGEKTFTRGLWCCPNYEAVYNIEGLGFKAFSAEVGCNNPSRMVTIKNTDSVVIFEIHVDGKVMIQSGLMGPGAPPKLMVVTGLEKAKTIAFVVRRDDMTNSGPVATWGDPKFYK